MTTPVQKKIRNPIAKAIKALGWIIENAAPEIGVRELAAALDMSPSSVHRLLAALVETGYVGQNPVSDRYSVGLEQVRLAHLVIARMPIRQAALPHMRKLGDVCNENVLLGVFDPVRQEMMMVASIESAHPLRYAVELNKWMPIYAGASGLAILAFLTDAEIAAVIDRTRLRPMTSQTIIEPYRLQTEIQRIRTRGYAYTEGQRMPDAVGLAAPIFGSDGEVVGDLCITIPKQRFDSINIDQIAEPLLLYTSHITHAIGGTVRTPGAGNRGVTGARPHNPATSGRWLPGPGRSGSPCCRWRR
jgi:DNA-binding IclR family transcriptional regulator